MLFRLILVLVIAGAVYLAVRTPGHDGLADDRRDVDLDHIIACANWSNDSYHEPDQIRRDVGSDVLIQEFPSSGLRVFITRRVDNGGQWVVIRGTANLTNVYDDMEFVEKEEHELGIRVHRGFDAALQECLPWITGNLDRSKPVVITGHSLGGAVAALLLAVLDKRGFEDVSAVTFGQPKVTNREGADVLSRLRLLRIMHEEDPVPLVPPLGLDNTLERDLYHHFGPEVILQPNGHFYYLTTHDYNRLSVTGFWSEISHIRPRCHDMVMGYLPALKAAKASAEPSATAARPGNR